MSDEQDQRAQQGQSVPSVPGASQGQATQSGTPEYPRKVWPRGLGNRRKMTPADIVRVQERKARRKKALELAIEGVPRREIARQLGCSLTVVKNDIKRELHALDSGTDSQAARTLAVSRRERELGKMTIAEKSLLSQLGAVLQAKATPSIELLTAIAKISSAKGRHLQALENMTVPPLPQRVEHTGARGGPIEIARLDDEQLHDLAFNRVIPSLPSAAGHGDAGLEGEAQDSDAAPVGAPALPEDAGGQDDRAGAPGSDRAAH